jgi:hypothetical protein
MNTSRQSALKECELNGIKITSRQFNISIQEYNNFEMSISERIKLISEKKDTKFIEYLKDKYKKSNG